jgi:hypothetical protein
VTLHHLPSPLRNGKSKNPSAEGWSVLRTRNATSSAGQPLLILPSLLATVHQEKPEEDSKVLFGRAGLASDLRSESSFGDHWLMDFLRLGEHQEWTERTSLTLTSLHTYPHRAATQPDPQQSSQMNPNTGCSSGTQPLPSHREHSWAGRGTITWPRPWQATHGCPGG